MFNKIQSMLEVTPERPASLPVIRRAEDHWNKSSIASLSAIQISRMNSQSLVEVVEQVQHFLPQSIVRSRLQLCDRVTLERLAYLARRICRNQGY